MNILDKIVADKRKEVELKKSLISASQLKSASLFNKQSISLSQNLKNSTTGIIAEHKRRSPSKAIINQNLNVQDVAKAYEDAGVSGISVLTDGKYFGGSLEDLIYARASVNIPILRKEFIIDSYQLLEAKAHGADVILLIAAVLNKTELKDMVDFAKQINLEVLLEIHNEEELEKSVHAKPDMIGVNNRNLKTFEVSLENSKNLAGLIPSEFVKVSESGISSIDAIKDLKNYGYQGFLIGENFMKTDDPGFHASQFIKKLNHEN